MRKDVEETDCGQIRGNILAFSWKDRGRPWKTWMKIGLGVKI